MSKAAYGRNGFIVAVVIVVFTYGSRDSRVQGSVWQACGQRKKLRVHILNHKKIKKERMNRKWGVLVSVLLL